MLHIGRGIRAEIMKRAAQSFEECPCCHNLPAPTGEEGRELHFYIQAAVHRGYRVLF